MTQIEQICAEIEHQLTICKKSVIESNKNGCPLNSSMHTGEEIAYTKMLGFINSLPQETVSDFDKHIQQGDEIVTGENGARVNISQLKRVAKKKEPVIEELEHAANSYADEHGFRVPYDGSNNFYDDVDVKASKEGFIAGANWQKQQDYKKYAHVSLRDIHDAWQELIKNIPDIRNMPAVCFARGADWQKEQMMKDAKEGIVTDKGEFIKFTDGTYIDLDPTLGLNHAFTLKEGDRVKVIVIK